VSEELARRPAAGVPISLAELERQRRMSDAKVDVARRAKAGDEVLVPLPRGERNGWIVSGAEVPT
jgi:hypothetical protein